MVGCPFNQGDTITLKQQYVSGALLEETQKYWLLEATQIATQMTVMIKIYINNKFPSISEAEKAWVNEISILQSKAGLDNLPVEYIESGSIMISNEKLFFIVLNYIGGIERFAETAEEDKMEFDDEETQSETSPSIKDELEPLAKEKQVIPPPATSFLREKDDFEAEKKIAITPSAPKPSGTQHSQEPKRSKRKDAVSELKEIPEEPKGIFLVEEKDYLKHISMGYFDRMNPQNYYPLTLSISDILQDKESSIINPITGERKIQTQSQLDVKLKNPAVKIRPILPGCNVVPREIETDFNRTTDEVTFFVTPLVKGEIVGKISFINEGKVFHTTEFKAKVVDPNYAKVVAFFGILASFVPKILSLLGMNIGLDTTIDTLALSSIAVIGGMNIASIIALVGIIPVIIISVLIRKGLKPKSTRVQYRIADFRLKDLKLPTTS